MRVGFDAHMVGERETGNETYALGLLQGFDRIGFPLDVYAFGPLEARLHRIHRIRPRQSAVRIPLSLPALAVRDRLDLVHTTYTLPPLLPCPAVVAVHDITFALHPEWFPARVRQMLNTLVPRAMRAASRVITISQSTKRDIVQQFRIPPEKIAVTYLAPRPALAPRACVAASDGGEPFFLFVGNVEPRKNVQTVIRALGILRGRGITVPLIVVGKPGVGYPDLVRLIEDLDVSELVRFAGYVPDEELRNLLASCTALLHPALYEGFGLTPLEAMAHGSPVIVSNSASLPEVVGDAGILLPPTDVAAWAQAMESVMQDRALRGDLGERGRKRAAQFSWERCAQETLEIYRAVLERP